MKTFSEYIEGLTWSQWNPNWWVEPSGILTDRPSALAVKYPWPDHHKALTYTGNGEA